VEQFHCEGCGQELFHLGDEPPPRRCEDCIPETGQGSRLVDQVTTNLRKLRISAGLSRDRLARRAATTVGEVSKYESATSHEPQITTALRFVCSLDASIDALVERVYWTPGQVLLGTDRQSPERLPGFFQVLPSNVPIFEPMPQSRPVATREEAAGLIGETVRAAREQRHLTQYELAEAAKLGRKSLSPIEQGACETSVGTCLALARALEVPAEFLFRGIHWEARPGSCSSRAHRPAHGADEPIRRMWAEGKGAQEIGEAVGRSPGSVSATIHRMRERGERLRYRNRPTRAEHERARRRRERCPMPTGGADDARIGQDAPEKIVTIENASHDEIGARLGANMSRLRQVSGWSYRKLAEAAELDFAYLHRFEKGKFGSPQLSLILRVAASLSAPYGALTAGIVWDPLSASFRIDEAPLESDTVPERIAVNAARARFRLDLSQRAVAERAAMGRSEIEDFERWDRNFRVFTVVRVAGALGIEFSELFAGVGNWYVRPLAPPEYLPGERPTKAMRDQMVVRLWNEGKPEAEIAEALDIPRKSISPYIRELRDAGNHLPYRRPPRGAVQEAARLKRRECSVQRTRAVGADYDLHTLR
jgi:transcriptional regulator with XRE-family HTH domain